MAAPKILAFAGSTRTESFNKKLNRVAAEACRRAGGEVTQIDLRDFSMPLFDGDLEAKEGLPENAKALRALFLAHRGLLLSSPEYNSSSPGVLKNAIDWVSRKQPGEPPLACFLGKVAALTSASPGQLGGLRALVTLRSILGNIKVLVLPDQVAIPKADEAFNSEGSLKDAKQAGAVDNLVKELVRVVSKLET